MKDKTRRPHKPLTASQVRNFLETLDDYGCADGRWTITPEGIKELCEAWLELNCVANKCTCPYGDTSPECSVHYWRSRP